MVDTSVGVHSFNGHFEAGRKDYAGRTADINIEEKSESI